MREIAGTVFGQNVLMAGLICHCAAIVCAMIPDFGGDYFFRIVYPISCLMLAAGTYAEIKAAGHPPFKGWRWYAAAALTVLPLAGPPIILAIIYCIRSGRKLTGIVPAILRMRANLLLVFVLLLLLFLLFAFLSMQHDPYFKRQMPASYRVSGIVNGG